MSQLYQKRAPFGSLERLQIWLIIRTFSELAFSSFWASLFSKLNQKSKAFLAYRRNGLSIYATFWCADNGTSTWLCGQDTVPLSHERWWASESRQTAWTSSRTRTRSAAATLLVLSAGNTMWPSTAGWPILRPSWRGKSWYDLFPK